MSQMEDERVILLGTGVQGTRLVQERRHWTALQNAKDLRSLRNWSVTGTRKGNMYRQFHGLEYPLYTPQASYVSEGDGKKPAEAK